VLVLLAITAVGDALRMGYGVFASRNRAFGARNDVDALARAAQRAYENPQADGSHQLCPSTSALVPAQVPRGKANEEPTPEQSAEADSECLGFRATHASC